MWGLGSCLFVVGALALLVVEIVHLAGMDDLPDESSEARFARLAGVDRVANGLMASGLTLLFALLVAVLLVDRLRRGGERPTGPAAYFRPYAGGWTAFLVAALAVFIGIGFSAAAATAVASALELNAEVKPGISWARTDVKVGTTLMLDRVAYVWGLTVVEILGIAIVLGVGYWLAKWTFKSAVDAQYAPPTSDATLPAGWAPRVARAWYVAQLKHRLPHIVICLVVVGMAMSLVQYLETTQHPSRTPRCGNGVKDGVIGSAADDSLPGLLSWMDFLSEPRGSGASIVWINLGAWVLIAGAGAIVAISRGALKDSGAAARHQRGVGRVRLLAARGPPVRPRALLAVDGDRAPQPDPLRTWTGPNRSSRPSSWCAHTRRAA